MLPKNSLVGTFSQVGFLLLKWLKFVSSWQKTNQDTCLLHAFPHLVHFHFSYEHWLSKVSNEWELSSWLLNIDDVGKAGFHRAFLNYSTHSDFVQLLTVHIILTTPDCSPLCIVLYVVFLWNIMNSLTHRMHGSTKRKY